MWNQSKKRPKEANNNRLGRQNLAKLEGKSFTLQAKPSHSKPLPRKGNQILSKPRLLPLRAIRLFNPKQLLMLLRRYHQAFQSYQLKTEEWNFRSQKPAKQVIKRLITLVDKMLKKTKPLSPLESILDKLRRRRTNQPRKRRNKAQRASQREQYKQNSLM